MRLLFIFLLVPSVAFAETLLKGENYRANTNFKVFDTKPPDKTCKTGAKKVGANSKFTVLNKDDDFYVIEFNKIYKYTELDPSKEKKYVKHYSQVVDHEPYYVPAECEDYGYAFEDLVDKSYAGIVSGPLIVPFKYRFDDKSITGEASIGYYVGWGLDFFNTGVGFTPILSAGLTQIVVSSSDGQGGIEEDTKTGFTWAAGFLFQDWDGVNFGLVYGQDRTGDQTWDHEGEGWLSVSVGWDL